MAVPASAVPTARAWLLHVDEAVRLAAGAHHVIEYLLAPPAVMLPRTPAYCPGVLLWREQMIPLVDIAPLLAQRPEGVSRWNHAVVLAWQDARGEPLKHGALVVRGAPLEIFVADDMACALPEGSAALASISLSCFDHMGKPVPVLDIAKLFSRPLSQEPPPGNVADMEGADEAPKAEPAPPPPAPAPDAGAADAAPAAEIAGPPSREQFALQYRLEFLAPAANEPLDGQYGPTPLQTDLGTSAETPATGPVETTIVEATVEPLDIDSPSQRAVAPRAAGPDSPQPVLPEEVCVQPPAEMPVQRAEREPDVAQPPCEDSIRDAGAEQDTPAPRLRSPAWSTFGEAPRRNQARGYPRSPLARKAGMWRRLTVGAAVALAFGLGVLGAKNWDRIVSMLEEVRPNPGAVMNDAPAEAARRDVAPGRVDASATPVAPNAPPN